MATTQIYPKVVYCSHHKCATKWFLNFLRFGSRRMGWRLANVDKDEALGGSARDFCEARKVDILFLSNAKFSSVKDLDVPVAHVVRDPRDMLVSGFFSHRDSHETENWPELVEYRRKIKACPVEEGLHKELEFSSQFLNNLEEWPLSGENLMTMRYEDFCSNPFEFVYQLVSFFDIVGDNGGVGRRFISRLMEVECKVRERLGVDRRILKKRDKLYGGEWLSHAFDMRFEKLKRGAISQVGPKGHYRQGGHGQWEGLFGPDMTQAFDQRYGHLVKHYGYSGDGRGKQGGEPAWNSFPKSK